MNSFLPKLFRWVFTAFTVLAALAGFCIVVVMLVDPALPRDAHFVLGEADFMGQSATMSVEPGGAGSEPVFSIRAFNGNATMAVPASGAIERLKRYGLPLLLLYTVFLATLFEVLRRLFRNVGRGESFTPQSVRLVQIVGGSLIVFSILCALGENWFAHGMYTYLADQTQFAISGTPARLPPPGTSPHWHLFDRSTFFYGLLVLALAEVFRQGLALRRENELTV